MTSWTEAKSKLKTSENLSRFFCRKTSARIMSKAWQASRCGPGFGGTTLSNPPDAVEELPMTRYLSLSLLIHWFPSPSA
jgi:hypothetical protein